MHGIFFVSIDKGNRDQVQKHIDEAFEPKFGVTVFSRSVLDHLLADFSKSAPFSNQSNIPTHLPVAMDILNNLAPIRVQSTVDVMFLDAATQATKAVEETGRNSFGDRIMSLFLPA